MLMKPECAANAEDGWFMAWAERRRDDAQGGLQLGKDFGDVGLAEGRECDLSAKASRGDGNTSCRGG